MLNRQSLLQFGLRFIICLAVLGGLYVAIFGLHPHGHKLPNTPTAKILRLRTALDQTYVDSSDITSFKQNDPASYALLSKLLGKLQTDVKALSTALKAAPAQVSGSEKDQIKAVIAQENGAVSASQTRYTVMNQVIAYDPQADLGNLDLKADSAKVATRAAAAAKGLQAAANSSLLTTDTQTIIKGAVSCFNQLASQAKTNDGQSAQTRSTCIKNYPTTRQAAIQNVIQGGLTTSYQNYLKQHLPPLLKQLQQQAR